VSPSAPELEEISILSHDEKLSNPKKFSTQIPGSFDGYARILSRLTVFSVSPENFFHSRSLMDLSTSQYPPGTAWHWTTGHRPLWPQQKNSIPRHPQRVRNCQWSPQRSPLRPVAGNEENVRAGL